MKTEMEMVKAIHEIMNECHCMGGITEFNAEMQRITVEIEWGDWKHQHIRFQSRMEETFPIHWTDKTVTEEDESDCYSAEYTFLFNSGTFTATQPEPETRETLYKIVNCTKE